MQNPAQNDEKHYCLICDQSMRKINTNAISTIFDEVDYVCNKADDHHFSYRIREGIQMIKMRIRLKDQDGSSLRLKIHYDSGYSEIWKKANCKHRTRIDKIIIPDFTNLDKLKSKIKTYLLFS